MWGESNFQNMMGGNVPSITKFWVPGGGGRKKNINIFLGGKKLPGT